MVQLQLIIPKLFVKIRLILSVLCGCEVHWLWRLRRNVQGLAILENLEMLLQNVALLALIHD